MLLAKLPSTIPFATTITKKLIGKYHLFPQPTTRNCRTVLQNDSLPCTQISDTDQASQLFLSGTKPNTYTTVRLLRACINTGSFSHGQQLHSHILKSGFLPDVFVSSALIIFYVKFELVSNAQKVFDEIPEPSLVSWNSLISGYIHSGQFRKALGMFLYLQRSNICADSYSFTAALSACGQLSVVEVGRSLHSKIVKYGVECSVFVANCLIDMYGKCGYVADAMKVFGRMIEKDIISWNSALAANARNGKLEQAFDILHRMPHPDTISYNELIHGISQFGIVEDAIALLSKLPNPNSSSWNSIITGCVNRGRGREALEIFCNMHSIGICMDEFTYSSILSGIANLSAIVWGDVTHCCALKSGLDRYVVVGSALIDMYSKCGQMEEAEMLFRSLPKKNLVTWNALISGHAHNGNFKNVIELFEQLKTTNNLKPDEITFLNVFSACWHSRIPISVANNYLETMTAVYGIDPMPEHCSLIIKLMGQEGDLSRAVKMIYEMEFDSCGMIWKTLLGACVDCGDVQVAEAVAKKVVEIEGDSEFVYVMMSNIYARYGKWRDVVSIRKVMKDRKIRKEAGYSWIQIEGVTSSSRYEFIHRVY